MDGEAHWNVDRIVRHEWLILKGKPKSVYLVHWEGFPSENDTFEPVANLINCSVLLAEYANRAKLAGGNLNPPLIC